MRETRPVIVIGDACVDVTVRLADLMVGHSDVFDSERLLPTISGGGTSANTAVALSKLGVDNFHSSRCPGHSSASVPR